MNHSELEKVTFSSIKEQDKEIAKLAEGQYSEQSQSYSRLQRNRGYIGLLDSLFIAVKNGNLSEVRRLISEGADVNAKDTNGRTPLHDAAYLGRQDSALLLLNKGADVQAKDDYGKTPLHYTAYSNKKDIAQLLVDKGANVNIKDKNGRTPLHDAAEKDNLDLVKLLIEKGADVQAKSANNQTALEVTHGNSEVANFLQIAKEAGNTLHYYEICYCHKEKATSGTSKPSSWMNGLVGWVKDSVGELFGARAALLGNLLTQGLPKESTSDSKPNVTTLEFGLSTVDPNSTILLLDIFIRKITGQRYVSSNTGSISGQEALGYALNITKEFEEVVEQAALRSGISMHRLNIDFMKVQKEVTRKITGGKFDEISGVLNSYVEKACPSRETGCPGKLSPKKFDKFMVEFNNRLNVVLNQPMQQILHNMNSTSEVNDGKEQQINPGPQSYLSNTSVQDLLTKAKDLG